MPSKSKAQAKLMRAACKNPKFMRKVGISKKVACEFMRADMAKLRKLTRKRRK